MMNSLKLKLIVVSKPPKVGAAHNSLPKEFLPLKRSQDAAICLKKKPQPGNCSLNIMKTVINLRPLAKRYPQFFWHSLRHVKTMFQGLPTKLLGDYVSRTAGD